MGLYRQGDVLLVPITTDELPEKGTVGTRTVRRADDGRLILAHGELTGHSHAFAAAEEDVSMRDRPETNDRFLEVVRDGGVLLEHPEHAAIRVPAGAYRVVRQREYTPERIVRVAD